MDEFFLENWVPYLIAKTVSTLSLYTIFHVERFEAHVGTFKEGTAFLGSDLGLRVLEVNLGPSKTEWKVLGP